MTNTRSKDTILLPNLLNSALSAINDLDSMLANLTRELQQSVVVEGKVSQAKLEEGQYEVHSFSWVATYVEALKQLYFWGQSLEANGEFDELNALLLQIGFGEYLSQLEGGIPMNQGEIARISQIVQDFSWAKSEGWQQLSSHGNSPIARNRLVELMQNQLGVASYGNTGQDEDVEFIRDQFSRFVMEKVTPHAQQWHLDNSLIPMELVDELAELGVFGLTISGDYGGSELPKIGMCVVSEELSRGFLGVGSLATRCEIASELISKGGTDEQKDKWLPLIASGEVKPTAVFTEPGSGSDLGSLITKGKKDGNNYQITGNKTWITHAGRANLMTLLVRTDPESSNYRGLSMMLAEKTAGTDNEPFPDQGLTGTEIDVIGYRGMKEYELSFSDFPVPVSNLLGDQEGLGFKQLMETFESARIQTAARAIGVAQSALDASLKYALERNQFGKPIVNFPRVSSKLAIMAVEIMMARQLTYYSARQKDRGRRCDLEAGMAKLLGARVAWAAADNGVQIHGGNGFAMEFDISRILCDARILNIFEGAAEIQANVIARRLLDPKAN